MKKLNTVAAKFVSFAAIFAMLLLSMPTVNAQSTARSQKFDFFGNGFSDWAVITFPNAGGQIRWNIARNNNPTPSAPGAARILSIPWGQIVTDSVVANGDYDGNGVDDINVYRNETASPANSYLILPMNTYPTPPANPIFLQWGVAETDVTGAEGDYDGDGKMDPTVVRAPTDTSPFVWYVLRTSDNTFVSFTYGNAATDIPLAGANYAGTIADDPAIARIGTGGALSWHYGTTTGAQINQVSWGDFDTDFVVPAGDYDGDGFADFMVWRGAGSTADGVWYLRTASGNQSFIRFGIPGATATRDTALRSGDYDGDGKTDIAVYRNSNRTFYVLRSTGGVQLQQWGSNVAGETTTPVASFGIF